MNDLKQIKYRNTYKDMPEILDNLYLEKTVGLSIIGLKLLKITILGIAPFRAPITRKNIAKTAVIAKCACGAYCKFNFKGLVSPGALPACGQCNADLDLFIQDYAQQHSIVLSRQDAWQQLGYTINPQAHSLVFWYLLNKSNYHHLRLGANFSAISQEELDQLNIPKYMYLSRACKFAPLQPDPQDPNIAYQCLCGAFCYFKVSLLQSFEPLGMCSACTDELRYSFEDTTIYAFSKQLRFKHTWKHLLQSFNYPYVEFRYVWEEYFKARKLVRKECRELHFNAYFHLYYQKYTTSQKQISL